MADLTVGFTLHASTINRYGKGSFTVGDRRIESALLLTLEAMIPLNITQLEDVTSELLQPLQAGEFPAELLLIGTGESLLPLPMTLRSLLNIPVDVMPTGAAIRTFNILRAEDRLAAALLFPL